MKKEKQYRKIEWALRNFSGKKKKKFSSWFGKLVTLVMSLMKFFPKKNKLNNSWEKMTEKERFEKIKWAMKNVRGRKRKKLKNLFNKLFTKAKSLYQKQYPEENIDVRIRLTQIPCIHNSAINYFDDQGFLYTKKTTYKNTMYLRCKQSAGENCKATAVVKNNDLKKVMLLNGHTHECNRKDCDKILFAKTLEKICMEEPFLQPLKCYDKAKKQLKGQIKRCHIPMPTYYSTFIHRKKKTYEPLLPKTINEFEKLIQEAKAKQYMYDDDDKIFYRGVWQGLTGRNITFISERTLKEVKRTKEVTLLMDGTFKAIPRHFKIQQLYIINVIISGRCYPLAYILMERKDFHSYMNVFSGLKKLIPSINVVNCMSDYEAATRKAIKVQFPNSRISGCYFHYVQAISKAFRRFGLTKNEEIFGDAINKICALALLPNEYVHEGFESISKEFKNAEQWARFESYWLKQWKKANISVYALVHRTNNYSESLNRTINLLIGGKRPNIWKLIHNLKIVESLKSDDLEQVVEGAMLKTRRSKKTICLNRKIEHATKIFKVKKDVEEFLKNVTFNDNLGTFFHKYGDSENGCEDDDEIIPNDYNVESDFRRKHQRKAAQKRKRSVDVIKAKKQKK